MGKSAPAPSGAVEQATTPLAGVLGFGATYDDTVTWKAAPGLPPNFHSYALLPIGFLMGRFGAVRAIPLADVVHEV